MGGTGPAGTIPPEPPERFFSKGRSGLHFLPRKMDQPSASNDCAGHRLGAARPATVFLRYERSDSFLSRTSDSAAVPIFFPGSNRLDLFSRGDFSSSVNWRSDPMRPADQRGPKGRECLCLSRAVLCGNAKRPEARCGARIAGTNLGSTERTPSPRSSPPMGARMHSSCVEMLARTRALEAVQPSALTNSRPCPTLAKVPNVPFKARCLCPGTPSTKRPRPLFLFRSGTCLCAPCLAHSIQWFAPIPVGDPMSKEIP